MSIHKYTEKIQELQAEIDKLSAAKSKLEAMPAEHQLAIQLHETLCTWNHTDGCSWQYEFSNGQVEWDGYAHGKYLAKARKLIIFCEEHNVQVDKVISVVDMVNGL